jgi:hypothetical protein
MPEASIAFLHAVPALLSAAPPSQLLQVLMTDHYTTNSRLCGLHADRKWTCEGQLGQWVLLESMMWNVCGADSAAEVQWR